MNVLVQGDRDYADEDRIYSELDAILAKHTPATMTVLQGGGLGAEKIARQWCLIRHVNFITVREDHTHPSTNTEPDVVLTFENKTEDSVK